MTDPLRPQVEQNLGGLSAEDYDVQLERQMDILRMPADSRYAYNRALRAGGDLFYARTQPDQVGTFTWGSPITFGNISKDVKQADGLGNTLMALNESYISGSLSITGATTTGNVRVSDSIHSLFSMMEILGAGNPLEHIDNYGYHASQMRDILVDINAALAGGYNCELGYNLSPGAMTTADSSATASGAYYSLSTSLNATTPVVSVIYSNVPGTPAAATVYIPPLSSGGYSHKQNRFFVANTSVNFTFRPLLSTFNTVQAFPSFALAGQPITLNMQIASNNYIALSSAGAGALSALSISNVYFYGKYIRIPNNWRAHYLDLFNTNRLQLQTTNCKCTVQTISNGSTSASIMISNSNKASINGIIFSIYKAPTTGINSMLREKNLLTYQLDVGGTLYPSVPVNYATSNPGPVIEEIRRFRGANIGTVGCLAEMVMANEPVFALSLDAYSNDDRYASGVAGQTATNSVVLNLTMTDAGATTYCYVSVIYDSPIVFGPAGALVIDNA